MKWTQQQREAIEYRNNNVLLAAAAGSGKTAVLVQRVIEMIEKDKISVNELLVLTFTDAAASEMREKIKKAINLALRENPDDEHMQKQKLLIHSSSISTVHSFCMNTLKSNIYQTDLPVEFSLVSETESSIMLKEALDEVLERFYKRIDTDYSFADLVMGYGGIKNDATLRETVLNLHKFSRSMADPSGWLNEALREYRNTSKCGELSKGWLSRRMCEFVEKTKDEILGIYRQIKTVMEDRLPKDHPYVPFFDDEAASLGRVFEHMNPQSYSSVKAELDCFEFPRMKNGLSKAEEDIRITQEKIKALRGLAKESLEDLKKCFSANEDEVLVRMKKTYPMLRTLKNIVLMLERRFTRKKRSKNFLDFNDLEHQMLKLVRTKTGENTEIAEKLQKKYAAILVDEYQDTNYIQEAIFRAVSRNNDNIFMVGDLKQSIYKFRNAVPKLFLNKYESYGGEDADGHLIQLFRNFRSRENVVSTVNFLFERIMSPEVGDVEYTEKEYLMHGAEYYPQDGCNRDFDTEFHVICKDVTDDDGQVVEALDKTEVEARFAVKRINEMRRDGFKVFDKEKNIMRSIEFRDIVILVRNPRSTAPIIEKVFDDCGIPVYTEVGHSYLGAQEIQTVMAFLQIIDNPRQDIPLIAVLRSPMWDFTPEELAEVRNSRKGGCFFDALVQSAEDGNAKAADFIEKLNGLRRSAEILSVDRIIYSIYYDFGYFAYVGSLKRGAERQANLRLLVEHATDFERTKLSGLFSFMNYIETMRAEGGDLVPAKTFGEGADVVRIMSIHKSKGLEFPVVFLMDTAHRFNLSDASKSVIWDGIGGMGAYFVDTKMRVKYSTLPRFFVGMELKSAFLSEEMRLLYVALTRAKEKLIITSTFRAGEKSWMTPVWDEKGCVALPYVRNSGAYREWLVSAFMLHPDAKELRDFCGISEDVAKAQSDFGMSVFVHQSPEEFDVEYLQDAQIAYEDSAEEAFFDELKKKFDFVYPNDNLGTLPVKLSVSEVKRMQAEEGDFVPLLEQLRTEEVADIKNISGAERGTVIHFVMQMLDPKAVNSAEDVERTVGELQNNGVLSRAQAKVVDCEKIADFFESAMGQRLKNAVRCETEFSFYTRASAAEIYGEGTSGEVLLQGTIDCFFVENNGHTVLLDFKTDVVKSEEAVKKAARRYVVQMKYYKKALEEILEASVDECCLYFLECGVFVDMNELIRGNEI